MTSFDGPCRFASDSARAIETSWDFPLFAIALMVLPYENESALFNLLRSLSALPANPAIVRAGKVEGVGAICQVDKNIRKLICAMERMLTICIAV
jgi:hypothetical protein